MVRPSVRPPAALRRLIVPGGAGLRAIATVERARTAWPPLLRLPAVLEGAALRGQWSLRPTGRVALAVVPGPAPVRPIATVERARVSRGASLGLAAVLE